MRRKQLIRDFVKIYRLKHGALISAAVQLNLTYKNVLIIIFI